MKARLAVVLAGLLFGLGLGLSGMTLPSKVLGFLDVTGAWDPSLALVMAGALAVHALVHRVARRLPSPRFDARFHLPTRRDLDPKLLAGAAIFGVGWGLGGICPGPGLVGLATGALPAVVFVGAMVAGMLLQHATAGSSAPAPAPSPRRRPSPTAPRAAPGARSPSR